MDRKVPLLFGCGCGGLLCILGVMMVIAWLWVPNVVEWGGNQFAAEQERRRVSSEWQPPAPTATPESFFPAHVRGYTLESQDSNASIPELMIDLSGWHAVYREQSSQIDVYAYRADHETSEAMKQKIQNVYDDHQNGSKVMTNVDYRWYYASTQHHQNHFWSFEGWLLVFRTKDSEDREPFVLRFLNPPTAEAVPEAEQL